MIAIIIIYCNHNMNKPSASIERQDEGQPALNTWAILVRDQYFDVNISSMILDDRVYVYRQVCLIVKCYSFVCGSGPLFWKWVSKKRVMN